MNDSNIIFIINKLFCREILDSLRIRLPENQQQQQESNKVCVPFISYTSRVIPLMFST